MPLFPRQAPTTAPPRPRRRRSSPSAAPPRSPRKYSTTSTRRRRFARGSPIVAVWFAVVTRWYVCWCRGGGGGLGEDAQLSSRWPAARPVVPFTPAQYEELEQQALIYKYLVAGVPVPPDLVVPIRRGLDSLATRFYGHPTRTAYPSSLSSAPCQPPYPSCILLLSCVLACSVPGVLTLCLFQSSNQVYFASIS